jgi:hypothetical protein
MEAPVPGAVRTLLTLLLLTAVLGCGAKQTEQTSASEPRAKSSTRASAVAPTRESASQPPSTKQSGPTHRITLTERGCIRFDPHWAEVHVGESVTWHSDLKSPVTIHVASGVFANESFVVRPGATVISGPARIAGNHSFWAEPTACHDAPRGALPAGPGVRVQEALSASAR